LGGQLSQSPLLDRGKYFAGFYFVGVSVIMRWLAAGLCLFFARFSLQKGEKTA